MEYKTHLNSSYIRRTVMGFWTSQLLLTAMELDLFTNLGDKSMTARELEEVLHINAKGIYDFLDSLVTLNLLERDGMGLDSKYKNTPETAVFLDKTNAEYIGYRPEIIYSQKVGFSGNLLNGLKTGQPQNSGRKNGQSFWDDISENDSELSTFLNFMSGLQDYNFNELAKKFDFSSYKTVTDIGGALALFSCIIGRHHPHLSFKTFDLPVVAPHTQKHINSLNMEKRIKIVSGDFFKDDLPTADVITMGNILHDWNLEKKKTLIQKVYDSLAPGGAFIVIEDLIDDQRQENLFGLVMSLNMQIAFGDGFNFTGADFRQWFQQVGFQSFDFIKLSESTTAAIAYK